MDSETLRAKQAPIKDKYREEPDSALVTLKAEGRVSEGISCKVQTGQAIAEAGLHPATGGDGSHLCSGDMLLEALVACAGVTFGAVATALELEYSDAVVRAEGDLDFRGTLGVSKEVPVGFRAIRLSFEVVSRADPDLIEKVVKLTERYCVVLQTIRVSPELSVETGINE